jgi:hypothetical protein
MSGPPGQPCRVIFYLSRPVSPDQPPLGFVCVMGCVCAPLLRRTAFIASEVFKNQAFLNKVEL